MVLCVERKMDQKNRLWIPADFIKKAGGELDGHCYVQFDEDTKEIKIIMKGGREDERREVCD